MPPAHVCTGIVTEGRAADRILAGQVGVSLRYALCAMRPAAAEVLAIGRVRRVHAGSARTSRVQNTEGRLAYSSCMRVSELGDSVCVVSSVCAWSARDGGCHA